MYMVLMFNFTLCTNIINLLCLGILMLIKISLKLKRGYNLTNDALRNNVTMATRTSKRFVFLI